MAQINDYLIANHFNISSVAKDTLYIYWGGANDIYYAMSNQTVTLQGVKDGLAELATGLPLLTTEQIEKLIDAGATNILIMSVPDWGDLPYGIQTFSAAQRQILTQFTNVINQAIIANISAIAPPGVTVGLFDFHDFIMKIRNNPNEFGFADVAHYCLQNFDIFESGAGGETPIMCTDPGEYFFWDAYHPSARGHAIIADAVIKFIER